MESVKREYFQKAIDLGLNGIEDPAFFLNVEMKDYRSEALDKAILLLEKYGFHDCYVIVCFNGDVTTLAHEKYGVKTQGFPLPMVKNLKENTECHYYASGIGMIKHGSLAIATDPIFQFWFVFVIAFKRAISAFSSAIAFRASAI